MKVASFSIGGRNYPNQDRLAVQDLGAHGTAAVLADGMGGLSLGDVAADVVTKSVIGFLKENCRGDNWRTILHKSLEHADKEVRKVSVDKRSNMGAAVVVIIVSAGQLYCTWQGNVRIYVRHEGETLMLTTDHIANVGYGRTALTRCIKGAGLREDLPYLCYQLTIGDQVLICSDGIYKAEKVDMGHMQAEEIKDKLGSPEDDASLIQITICP